MNYSCAFLVASTRLSSGVRRRCFMPSHDFEKRDDGYHPRLSNKRASNPNPSTLLFRMWFQVSVLSERRCCLKYYQRRADQLWYYCSLWWRKQGELGEFVCKFWQSRLSHQSESRKRGSWKWCNFTLLRRSSIGARGAKTKRQSCQMANVIFIIEEDNKISKFPTRKYRGCRQEKSKESFALLATIKEAKAKVRKVHQWWTRKITIIMTWWWLTIPQNARVVFQPVASDDTIALLPGRLGPFQQQRVGAPAMTVDVLRRSRWHWSGEKHYR